MSQLQHQIFSLNHFHNSLQETDERKLALSENITKAQDEKILEFMRTHVRKEGWTSWEIHSEHFPHMLETSVRRALTDISYDIYNEKGYVFKTRERRMGGHGSKVAVWQYVPPKKLIKK